MTLFGFCSWAKYHFFFYFRPDCKSGHVWEFIHHCSKMDLFAEDCHEVKKKGTAWNFLPNDKWNLEANTGLLIEAFFSLWSSHSLSYYFLFADGATALLSARFVLALLASCQLQNGKKIVALLPPSLLPCTVVFSSAFTLYCFAENPLSLCNDQCIPRSKIIHHCQEEMF